MALFFVLVGLEIKRELLDGQLASWPHRILPGVAAIGGMIAPALVYLAINAVLAGDAARLGDPGGDRHRVFARRAGAARQARAGVAQGVPDRARDPRRSRRDRHHRAVLRPRPVAADARRSRPPSLAALVALNRFGVTRLAPIFRSALVLWFLVLQSGVHATVAGVLFAITIPLQRSPGHPDDAGSPLHRLENALQPWVVVPGSAAVRIRQRRSHRWPGSASPACCIR